MRELTFDTETTGFWSDARIISLALVELEDSIPTGRYLQFFLNPSPSPIDPRATEVHGLIQADLDGCPTFRDVATSVLGFIDGDPLIIHKASFDIPRLSHELSLVGRRPYDGPVVCTYCIARKRFGNGNGSLDKASMRMAIPNFRDQRPGHGALTDALQLVHVYRGLNGMGLLPCDFQEVYGAGLDYETLKHSGRTRADSAAGADDVTGDAGASSGGAGQGAGGDAGVHHQAEAGGAESAGSTP